MKKKLTVKIKKLLCTGNATYCQINGKALEIE